jgi:hypothetical protein
MAKSTVVAFRPGSSAPVPEVSVAVARRSAGTCGRDERARG